MMEEKSNKMVSIIVTCKVKDYLYPCLGSIKKQAYRDLEVMVIDNSCDNDFSQSIIERYPQVKLYSTGKNLSFCAALNFGIEQSRGDFILCLNDDATLREDFIEEALKGFFSDKKIGMVSGKILRSDRKTLDSAGLSLSIFRTAKERGYGVQDKGQFEKAGYIFGVTGAAAFYRKEMLEDIKEGEDYFDSDFHFFYEDLDIAWRARRNGWKGYYMPTAIAYHVRGGTARKNGGIDKRFAQRYLNQALHFDLIKNRYLCLIKNESLLGLLLHFPCVLVYDLILWGYFLLFRPGLIKILLFNLKYFKTAFRKRRFYRFSRR